MAVPMVWVEDPDPARRYLCPGCGADVPLSGYRLLYQGKRRPLRCRACEIAGAPTEEMRRYYAGKFEATQASKRVYAATHAEEARARAVAWKAAHRDEERAYERAYWQLNRDRLMARCRAYYGARRDEIGARARAAYAATHGTPEAIAARAQARERKRAERRARFRRRICRRVAAHFDLEPEALVGRLVSPVAREARQVGLYLTVYGSRVRDRQPMAEVAAFYGIPERTAKRLATTLMWRVRGGGSDLLTIEARTFMRRLREEARARHRLRLTRPHEPLSALVPQRARNDSPRARYERLMERRRAEREEWVS